MVSCGWVVGSERFVRLVVSYIAFSVPESMFVFVDFGKWLILRPIERRIPVVVFFGDSKYQIVWNTVSVYQTLNAEFRYLVETGRRVLV